jgi:hypothetical protein
MMRLLLLVMLPLYNFPAGWANAQGLGGGACWTRRPQAAPPTGRASSTCGRRWTGFELSRSFPTPAG